MNTKIKFLEIVLSDLVSQRDTLELELNRILNKEENVSIKKKEFNYVLTQITSTNSKIQMLSDYLTTLGSLDDKTENNNNV
jgi:hypothetical protein